MIALLVVVLASLAWFAWLGRAGLMVARIYQIEEYDSSRLLNWGRQQAWLWPKATLLGGGIALALGLLPLALSIEVRQAGVVLGWLVGTILLHVVWKPLPAKKALVYTPRMRRILASGVFLALLVVLGMAIFILTVPIPLASIIVALTCFLAPALVLFLVVAGNALMMPVEAQIRRSFLHRAHARITNFKPLVIGITGSYGKTSTKNFMAQLLAPHKETLATPKSFNTLMGITRTINECLEPKHKIFVVEMDPYDRGEVATMCHLVEPKIAVITSVGPQHLERFGSIERISDALYELVEALPSGSPVVIYGGENMAARLAKRATQAGYRVVRYGLEGETDETLDVVALDIVVDERSSYFTWRWASESLEYHVSIPLLGRHNILNISAVLATMHLLGIPVSEAVRHAIRLEPVPHRLQLMPATGDIIIIDDSYNANPVGVHNGLDVLAQMRGRTKILVTPGLVELGSVEEAENHRFGQHAARVCNHVILVGVRQTRPIFAGLLDGGFSRERIHVVNTLEEVTRKLSQISGPGDVVLFANDLPDTYLELK